METALPISRIRTIMKSSLDTGKITNEVLFIMSKSTELFIKDFTKHAYGQGKEGSVLKYEDLSEYVQEMEHLEFLLQIIPQKIKVKDFRELERSNESDNSSDSDGDA